MAFLFVDLFDTIGTVIGCASKANLLDADGKLPKVKQVLLTDAIGTTAGSLLGTSTVTTFVESSAGIAEGGKTGLTAVPAYITIFSMAFMYSISEGICFGVISYTLLHVGTGKSKIVTPLMYILTLLFIMKYALL